MLGVGARARLRLPQLASFADLPAAAPGRRPKAGSSGIAALSIWLARMHTQASTRGRRKLE